jgi:hypothetical protein
MEIEEMRQAVNEAEGDINRRNRVVADMAHLIAGNLRGADVSC